MAEYLFLMTIGPVQEFIATARRTRDLWYGSWMLSELSRAAAEAILTDNRNTLIFPDPSVIKSTDTDAAHEPASVANKIVAKIETDNIEKAARYIKRAVIRRMSILRTEAFKSISDWSSADQKLAKQQVAKLLECYWAAVPLIHEDRYYEQRKLLEEVISARKATRQFTQVQLTEEQGRYPKSSLDGKHESVIRESAYPDRKNDVQQRRKKLKALYASFGAKQAERLSGVDLLKRRGNYKDDQADFPSTSHFAAVPFIEQLVKKHGNDKIRNMFNEYRTSLETLITDQRMVRLEKLNERYRLAFAALDNYDASILYMSRLAEEIDVKDEETRRSAEQALQNFLKHAANEAQPKAYYAILQADGDSMGKVIDNQKSIAAHQMLSGRLAAFAKAARSIVEQYRGALVYAGGDDVLALLPVDSVLQCAHDLHSRFDEFVGIDYRCATCAKPQFVDEACRSPTLSIGVAICHHLEPLNDALILVGNAEKAAKHVPGKNGLAISVDKRSGEPQQIAGGWAGDSNFFTRVQSWLRLMQDNELSAGAPYELRDLTERLGEPRELKDEFQSQHRAIAEEAGRIIERKRGKRGSEEASKLEILSLREWLGLPEKKPTNDIPVSNAPGDGKQSRKQKLTVRQLADELIVARELVRLGARVEGSVGS